MINTIIFDFGDIFINLEHQKATEEFQKLGLMKWNEDLATLNQQFEIGKITELQFLEGFQKYTNNADLLTIRGAWNSLMGIFPLYRLEFLQILSQKYRLFLLSNTDEVHISHFEHKSGLSFSRDFYQCFEKIYFSYEIGMRKPDEAIFNHLIQNHNLSPKRTLFIDDKEENTNAALAIGLQVWNLKVGKEDVVDLYDKNIL